MFNKKNLYECDPEKNKDCKKTECMYNKVNPGKCHLTSRKEFEKTEEVKEEKKEVKKPATKKATTKKKAKKEDGQQDGN